MPTNSIVNKDNMVISIPNSPKSPKSNVVEFLVHKVQYFKKIVHDSLIAVQRYRSLDIITQNDFYNVCTLLRDLSTQLNAVKIAEGMSTNLLTNGPNSAIANVQRINDELACLFRTYGTLYIDDLVSVCIHSDYMTKHTSAVPKSKLDIIRRNFHPISYKVLPWKNIQADKKRTLQKNRIVEDQMIVDNAMTMECFDMARTAKTFAARVYGMRIALQDAVNKRTVIVNGIVDDISVLENDSPYVKSVLVSTKHTAPKLDDFTSSSFDRFLSILTLKEVLVYSENELHDKFVGYMNQIRLTRQKPMPQLVREFLGCDMYSQRSTLIQLLIRNDESEFQYLAYLLYDLLSSESNGSADTKDQLAILDSFPWSVRRFFKDAMKQTVKYSESLSTFDTNKIPLEQQICLLKAPDSVKEKAMLKLKEVKSKSEDSGSKARQYLDGLLRIPFGSFRQEPVLCLMPHARQLFSDLCTVLEGNDCIKDVVSKPATSLQMRKTLRLIKDSAAGYVDEKGEELVVGKLTSGKRNHLVDVIAAINGIIREQQLKFPKLTHSGKNIEYMKSAIRKFVSAYRKNVVIWQHLLKIREAVGIESSSKLLMVPHLIGQIESDVKGVNDFLIRSRGILDASVHGHEKAKRQIERILGQWINGESSGYCFGFEGPPGVGKTSLAKKGIAQCLSDEEGNARPFSFVPIGGSSNGSTLEGHNYTYVGSTWGRIVDIVIDSRCLNPIIFVDELDKVSATEHGKEIIGILTHLVDPTQNDAFNDKYFNGIDIDLSKALFVFSYNDPQMIDRILLDRIHRVRFDHLSISDKLTIVNDYMFPDILEKMGLQGMVKIDNETLTRLIEEYTAESGVRKLKELLFEIAGEINLKCLGSTDVDEIPIQVTYEDIENQYLKNRNRVRIKRIPDDPIVGTVNGMWANAMGQGGVLPIEAKYMPGKSSLELHLTGMQGDVMKESMSVAKTVALTLLDEETRESLCKKDDTTECKGVHIHCPEGATPKDGPSAGAAITLVLYSLFTNRKIDNEVAMTGEINLRGQVTAIGGLDLKILGGIRAGAKRFMYPQENEREFNEFMEKYKGSQTLEGIEFKEVSCIDEVIEFALCE